MYDVKNINIGDEIEIIDMFGEPQYSGRIGTVESIDDIGQIHGTWGGCALIPGDKFIVTKKGAAK